MDTRITITKRVGSSKSKKVTPKVIEKKIKPFAKAYGLSATDFDMKNGQIVFKESNGTLFQSQVYARTNLTASGTFSKTHNDLPQVKEFRKYSNQRAPLQLKSSILDPIQRPRSANVKNTSHRHIISGRTNQTFQTNYLINNLVITEAETQKPPSVVNEIDKDVETRTQMLEYLRRLEDEKRQQIEQNELKLEQQKQEHAIYMEELEMRNLRMLKMIDIENQNKQIMKLTMITNEALNRLVKVEEKLLKNSLQGIVDYDHQARTIQFYYRYYLRRRPLNQQTLYYNRLFELSDRASKVTYVVRVDNMDNVINFKVFERGALKSKKKNERFKMYKVNLDPELLTAIQTQWRVQQELFQILLAISQFFLSLFRLVGGQIQIEIGSQPINMSNHQNNETIWVKFERRNSNVYDIVPVLQDKIMDEKVILIQSWWRSAISKKQYQIIRIQNDPLKLPIIIRQLVYLKIQSGKGLRTETKAYFNAYVQKTSLVVEFFHYPTKQYLVHLREGNASHNSINATTKPWSKINYYSHQIELKKFLHYTGPLKQDYQLQLIKELALKVSSYLTLNLNSGQLMFNNQKSNLYKLTKGFSKQLRLQYDDDIWDDFSVSHSYVTEAKGHSFLQIIQKHLYDYCVMNSHSLISSQGKYQQWPYVENPFHLSLREKQSQIIYNQTCEKRINRQSERFFYSRIIIIKQDNDYLLTVQLLGSRNDIFRINQQINYKILISEKELGFYVQENDFKKWIFIDTQSKTPLILIRPCSDYSVVVIQKLVRGFLSRRRSKHLKQKILNHCIFSKGKQRLLMRILVDNSDSNILEISSIDKKTSKRTRLYLTRTISPDIVDKIKDLQNVEDIIEIDHQTHYIAFNFKSEVSKASEKTQQIEKGPFKIQVTETNKITPQPQMSSNRSHLTNQSNGANSNPLLNVSNPMLSFNEDQKTPPKQSVVINKFVLNPMLTIPQENQQLSPKQSVIMAKFNPLKSNLSPIRQDVQVNTTISVGDQFQFDVPNPMKETMRDQNYNTLTDQSIRFFPSDFEPKKHLLDSMVSNGENKHPFSQPELDQFETLPVSSDHPVEAGLAPPTIDDNFQDFQETWNDKNIQFRRESLLIQPIRDQVNNVQRETFSLNIKNLVSYNQGSRLQSPRYLNKFNIFDTQQGLLTNRTDRDTSIKKLSFRDQLFKVIITLDRQSSILKFVEANNKFKATKIQITQVVEDVSQYVDSEIYMNLIAFKPNQSTDFKIHLCAYENKLIRRTVSNLEAIFNMMKYIISYNISLKKYGVKGEVHIGSRTKGISLKISTLDEDGKPRFQRYYFYEGLKYQEFKRSLNENVIAQLRYNDPALVLKGDNAHIFQKSFDIEVFFESQIGQPYQRVGFEQILGEINLQRKTIQIVHKQLKLHKMFTYHSLDLKKGREELQNIIWRAHILKKQYINLLVTYDVNHMQMLNMIYRRVRAKHLIRACNIKIGDCSGQLMLYKQFHRMILQVENQGKILDYAVILGRTRKKFYLQQLVNISALIVNVQNGQLSLNHEEIEQI